jgi:hypothetical protein
MPDIKVPFGFETQVSTDLDETGGFASPKGFQAQVTLNGIVVFKRYYRESYSVSRPWRAAHPIPSDADQETQAKWAQDLQKALKNTASDDQDAADTVLTDFAHRLALTLTWPDGA